MTDFDLSICFSTYGQPVMLRHWFDRYLEQPEKARERVEIVVVDDCGDPPADPPPLPNLSLLRVLQDRPWNQPGARNLAVMQARGNAVLLIDPDMTFPANSLGLFLEAAKGLKGRNVIKPILRRVTDNKFDASSPNVHLLLRSQFMDVRGYNEDYVGHKGWSDVELLLLLLAVYRVQRMDHLWLWLHHGDKNIVDAQVQNLDRNVSHNKKLHVRNSGIMRKIGWRRWIHEQQGKMARFEWTKLR